MLRATIRIGILGSVLLLSSLRPAHSAPAPPATNARVSFTATGPARARVHGTTDILNQRSDSRTLTLTVPLATLQTGNILQDREMHTNVLEVQKYPFADIHVSIASLRRPGTGVSISARTSAFLTLHGTRKQVSLLYGVTRDGPRYFVYAEVQIDVQDFGIVVPSRGGISLNPRVEIEARFVTTDKDLR